MASYAYEYVQCKNIFHEKNTNNNRTLNRKEMFWLIYNLVTAIKKMQITLNNYPRMSSIRMQWLNAS